MKNRILKVPFALIAIVVLTTIAGCKKGENDPFLSLKSRKARISGEWKLSEGTLVNTSTDNGFTESEITTYNGTSVSYDGDIYAYTETLTIDKEGTFEVKIVEDGEAYTVRGNWFFSGKSKDADLKKKEAIIFSETEYISASGISKYTGLYGDQILLIDQLKNKEIIFKGEVTYQSSDGYSGTYTYDRTFEKQ